ncbi:MAG: hypothetical protein H6742_11035 [Alphaproteobacteria bacterium]|nr:hypothetical protein [Alphaproteobacteria bacterium]
MLLLFLLPGALAGTPLQPDGMVVVGATAEQGATPAFFEQPRDRIALWTAGSWRPSSQVALHGRVDGWRQDRYDDGRVLSGPGDIRLAAEGYVPARLADIGIGTWVKLPNADDRRELGTDETDLGLDLVMRWQAEEGLLARGRIGLEVLGDPERIARQAVRPASSVELSGRLWRFRGRDELWGTVSLGTRSVGQEGRAQAYLGYGWVLPCPVRWEARAEQALSGPVPTASFSASIGWQSGCRAD